MGDRRTRGLRRVVTSLVEKLELDNQLSQNGRGQHDLPPES